MFKGQPKGLYALALANTGERFGYYTMLAILTLFLQAKFGYTTDQTSTIYPAFLALVYFMPLVGGILADKFGYGKMVTTGIVIMFIGYLVMAMPTGVDTTAKVMMFGSLLLISIGTGLFKGNLQVLVGNLYDNPQYAAKRDSAFSLFYMAINIGAMFAPTAAEKITQWVMGRAGLFYNANIPALAHQLQNGTITDDGMTKLSALAAQMPDALAAKGGDLQAFAAYYIEQLSTSYHYAFGVACVSLIISMAIYWGFRKTFKSADVTSREAAASNAPVEELTPQQTKNRIVALMLVFAVVIFFWMSFHQNGLTLTFFARDYTQGTAAGGERMIFDVVNLALIAIGVYAVFGVFQADSKKGRITGLLVTAAVAVALILKYEALGDTAIDITPQKFQQFNPFFVVALTPFSLAIFGALSKRGKEPSAPRKIGLGMLVAAVGFGIMTIASMGLASPAQLAATGGVSDTLVSPNWLISTYLVLTFAELLLSPMGISFVSKVAPPKYKGAMMGCWFAATAIGNYLVSIIGYLWSSPMPLWSVWVVLISLCLLSALFIFSVMRKLENATK